MRNCFSSYHTVASLGLDLQYRISTFLRSFLDMLLEFQIWFVAEEYVQPFEPPHFNYIMNTLSGDIRVKQETNATDH